MGIALIPAIGAIAGAAAPTALGVYGQSQANASNAKEAKRQREFQERMRATQYQTAVEDMRKAGLNPALAYSQGGAGTPSGAMARMESTTAGVTGGVDSALTNAVAVANAVAQTRKTNAEAAQINLESSARVAQIEAQIAQLKASTEATDAQKFKTGAETSFVRQQMEFNAKTLQERMDQIMKENNLLDANAAESRQRRKLGEQNEVHDFYKRNVGRFVNDARHAAQLITQFIPLAGAMR